MASVADPWYHYRARALRADAGRFVQRDPVQYRDGSNMYSYVSHAPQNRVDPLGLAGQFSSGGAGHGFGQINHRPQPFMLGWGHGIVPQPLPVDWAFPGTGVGPGGYSIPPTKYVPPAVDGWQFKCPKFVCNNCHCEKATDYKFTQSGMNCTVTKQCGRKWDIVKCHGLPNPMLFGGFDGCDCLSSESCTYVVTCPQPQFSAVIDCNMCKGFDLPGWERVSQACEP